MGTVIVLVFLGLLSITGVATGRAFAQVEARIRPHVEIAPWKQSVDEFHKLPSETQREIAQRFRQSFVRETDTERSSRIRELLSEPDFHRSRLIQETTGDRFTDANALTNPIPRAETQPIHVGKGDMVFLNVTRKGTLLPLRKLFSVEVRSGPDVWMQQAGFPELSNPIKHNVSSLTELNEAIGGASIVVHQGADLPQKWQDSLGKEHRLFEKQRSFS